MDDALSAAAISDLADRAVARMSLEGLKSWADIHEMIRDAYNTPPYDDFSPAAIEIIADVLWSRLHRTGRLME